MAKTPKHKFFRARNKTIAGTHIPVLTEEVIAQLAPRPGQVVVDCTLGYGGHATAFLKRIGPAGRLIGIDADGIELERTKKRLSSIDAPMSFHHSNFVRLPRIMQREKLDSFDIIFADLGVSSMQVDDPSRGISYKNDSPLDMRMDTRLQRTGADLLAGLSADELSDALWELSDEPDHKLIADMIVAQQRSKPITQTSQLLRLILNAKGLTEKTWKKQQKNSAFGSLHPAARTFQALRILVNDELNSLKELLRIAPDSLRANGRIGIISFHRGEDTLVQNAFEEGIKNGLYTSIAGDPITPKVKEVRANPRSASAKFRWAVKAE